MDTASRSPDLMSPSAALSTGLPAAFPEPAGGTALDLVREWLAHRDARWVLGAIGAIAEFEADAEYTPDASAFSASGRFGAIRVDARPEARALAYELPSADPRAWLHGVVLCLPQPLAAGIARTAITELGRDLDAIRDADRDSALFDLGIGSPWCEVCVRSDDPALLRQLRSFEGHSILDPEHDLLERIPQASPARVFRSRLARIEVWQRIPRHGEASPQGSHTHFLPKMLRPSRTVAASVPVPQGWIACLSLLPPNPQRDSMGVPKPLDRGDCAAFDRLLERFGDPGYVRAKRAALRQLHEGLDVVDGRDAQRSHRIATIVAARQYRALCETQ